MPALVGLLALAACGGGGEDAAREAFATADATRLRGVGTAGAEDAVGPAAPAPGRGGAAAGGDAADNDDAADGDGAAARSAEDAGRGASLARYVALALAESPAVEAAFARWRASVLRISRARRLPEPTLSFGWFVREVETRVGPQDARLALQQAFPWPARLSAGADAAAAQARAAERRFEAEALAVAARVAEAYWSLWLVRRARALQEEEVALLDGLSATVSARVTTGGATLGDQLEVDLARARLEDAVRGQQEAERAAAARLRAAVGAEALPEGLPTPVDPPPAALPAEPHAALVEAARSAPRVASMRWLGEAQEAQARVEESDRWPAFTLGLDWILTGEARMPNVVDSSKDAVVLGLGLRLPLWQGSYADAADAARAEAAGHRAEARAVADAAEAELEATLAAVRDAARRVDFTREVLVPRATALHDAALGAIAAGRAPLDTALRAQRQLVELRLALDRARADHARAWADLERVTGRAVRRASAETRGAAGSPGR